MLKLVGTALSGHSLDPWRDAPALADPVADFYKGKQIRFIVRTLAGGDYDQYTRLIARFIGKYIPGNPPIVVVNMPGGGGITAANYMAQVAPRDGTVIGIVSQGLAVDQALGASPGSKADLREFNWIANVVHSNQILVVWHTSPTKTIGGRQEPRHHHRHDRRRLGVGAVSRRSTTMCSAPNSRSCSAIPAGRSSISRWSAARSRAGVPILIPAGWRRSRPGYPEKKIIPLIQAGIEKEPDAAGRAADHRSEGAGGGQAAPVFHGELVVGRAPTRHDTRRAG